MNHRFVCFTDINECLDSPCQNDGECSNSEGAYSCDCTDTGYNGTNCETGKLCAACLCTMKSV